MSDDLRDRLAAALKEVRLRLGPNALVMAQRGEPLMLSGGERDQAADAVLAVVQSELDRLRAVEADYTELTSRAHPLAACSHGVHTVPVATLAAKIAEKREALAQRNEACREVDRTRAERDAALATLARVREMAERMAALAPPDDWGESMSDTALADAGRAMLAVLAGPAGAGSTQDGA